MKNHASKRVSFTFKANMSQPSGPFECIGPRPVPASHRRRSGCSCASHLGRRPTALTRAQSAACSSCNSSSFGSSAAPALAAISTQCRSTSAGEQGLIYAWSVNHKVNSSEVPKSTWCMQSTPHMMTLISQAAQVPPPPAKIPIPGTTDEWFVAGPLGAALNGVFPGSSAAASAAAGPDSASAAADSSALDGAFASAAGGRRMLRSRQPAITSAISDAARLQRSAEALAHASSHAASQKLHGLAGMLRRRLQAVLAIPGVQPATPAPRHDPVAEDSPAAAPAQYISDNLTQAILAAAPALAPDYNATAPGPQHFNPDIAVSFCQHCLVAVMFCGLSEVSIDGRMIAVGLPQRLEHTVMVCR